MLPDWVNAIPNGTIFHWVGTHGQKDSTDYSIQESLNPQCVALYYKVGERDVITSYEKEFLVETMKRGSRLNGMLLGEWITGQFETEEDSEIKLNMDLI